MWSQHCLEVCFLSTQFIVLLQNNVSEFSHFIFKRECENMILYHELHSMKIIQTWLPTSFTDKSSGPIISILSWGWMTCESRLEQLLHLCLAPTSFGLLKDIASVIFLSPASSSLLLDDFRNTQILSYFSHLKTKQTTPSLPSPLSSPDILHFSPLCTAELCCDLLTHSNFSSPILSSPTCNKGFSPTITQITLRMLPNLMVSSCSSSSTFQ